MKIFEAFTLLHWHASFSQILYFERGTLGFGQHFDVLKCVTNARDLKSVNDGPS